MNTLDPGTVEVLTKIYQCVFHRIDMFLQMYYGVVIGFLPVIAAIIGFIEKRESKDAASRAMNPLYFFIPYLFAGIVGTLTGLTIYANQDGAYLKFIEEVLGHSYKVNPFAYESVYSDFFLRGKMFFPYSKWANLVFLLYFVPMIVVLVYIFYRYWEQPKSHKSLAKDMVLLGGIGVFLFSLMCFPFANYDVRKEGAQLNRERVGEFLKYCKTEEVKPPEKNLLKPEPVQSGGGSPAGICQSALPLGKVSGGLKFFGILAFLFGLFSSLWPKASIGFYAWMMSLFNWKVIPLDEPKEVRNTRVLGIVLAVLGMIIVLRFCS